MTTLYETTTPAPAPLAVLGSYTLPGGTLATDGQKIVITTTWTVPDPPPEAWAAPKAYVTLFGACVAFAEVRAGNDYRVITTVTRTGASAQSASSLVGPQGSRPRLVAGAAGNENLAADVAIVAMAAVPVAGSLTLTSFKVELL